MSTEESARPQRENTGSTGAEAVAWWIAGIGAGIFVIAIFVFFSESSDVWGDTSGPLAWMVIGATIAGIGFVPAIILTGVRQLLPAGRR
ncbi:hypothetical protein [Microbacterium soli]|uniref:Multidrug ABC transporter ATPase n=1 Tax=Microbacterium soli TaxID=446075 RepID=A0ABP7NLU1_9MICO